MAAITGEDQRLVETDGFILESSEGDVGHVEEVWVGEANEPHALAVRTSEGRHCPSPSAAAPSVALPRSVVAACPRAPPSVGNRRSPDVDRIARGDRPDARLPRRAPPHRLGVLTTSAQWIAWGQALSL